MSATKKTKPDPPIKPREVVFVCPECGRWTYATDDPERWIGHDFGCAKPKLMAYAPKIQLDEWRIAAIEATKALKQIQIASERVLMAVPPRDTPCPHCMSVRTESRGEGHFWCVNCGQGEGVW